MKAKPNKTYLELLEEAMWPLVDQEQRLLGFWDRQARLFKGEQWATAPDGWWQAAHLVLGPFLQPENPSAPDFSGGGGGCSGPPAGLDSTRRGQGHACLRAPTGTDCMHCLHAAHHTLQKPLVSLEGGSTGRW